MSEEEIRKNWKEFFKENSKRFTDSKKLAEEDSNLIYVSKDREIACKRFPNEASEILYEGQLKDW